MINSNKYSAMSLETTKPGKNFCTWKSNNKQRRSGTQQLELNFDGSNGSHNIYFIKSTYAVRSLAKSSVSNKLDKPVKSIWLDVSGRSDSLKVSVRSIKSYYKDISSNIWLEVIGQVKPIQLRNSIREIENKINRSI